MEGRGGGGGSLMAVPGRSESKKVKGKPVQRGLG